MGGAYRAAGLVDDVHDGKKVLDAADAGDITRYVYKGDEVSPDLKVGARILDEDGKLVEERIAFQDTSKIPGAGLTREQRLIQFDSPQERSIAEFLEDQGRIVIKNPLEGVKGAGRQGDAIMDGIKTEFKTLDPGAKNGTIKNVVNRSISHEGQARQIVIDARESGLSEELARKGTYRALGASNGKLDFIEVIGNRYFFRSVPKN